MFCFMFKNLNEFRSGFSGNNMMYYMGQYGPILSQPITSMLVNERPHNCNTGRILTFIHILILYLILINFIKMYYELFFYSFR